MREIFLSSSAFKADAYDLRKTVWSAVAFGFSGVQLWLGPGMIEREQYLVQLRDLAAKNHLKIILHLSDDFDETFLPAILNLLHFQRKRRVILHFFAGMNIPAWPGIEFGLENAFSGYDEGYYWELFRAAREGGHFLVFDLPRLFAIPPDRERETIAFARRVLKRMKGEDVLHLIDFHGYHSSRRHWCPWGEGTMKSFGGDIAKFPGTVVLEYEELEMALKSRTALLEL